MPPTEVLSRMRGLAGEAQERIASLCGRGPRLHRRLRADARARLNDVMPLTPSGGEVREAFATCTGPEWRDRLRCRAEAALAHRFTYLGLEDMNLGTPIDWNRDHAHDVATPLKFAGRIDYRDFGRVGDCKLVWEPNRHHQLVVLGRWYALTADRAAAREVVAQIEGWMDASPFLRGMNWRSPLELSIRLINWSWALNLIRDAGVTTPAFERRVLECVADHIGHVARHYSDGSSANNHLIGEAAGVWIGTNVFRQLRNTERLRAHSQAVLEKQIALQTFADGGSTEQATGYLLFVAQFFLLAGLVGRRAGRDFSPQYWHRLEGVFDFLHTFSQMDGRLPQIGDADDGYVLDLGGEPGDVNEWTGAAAVVFRRPDWLAPSGDWTETALWLLGTEAQAAYADLRHTRDQAVEPALAPRAFPHSGYYVLQAGHSQDPEACRVIFDCGSLGQGSLAAHGHADSLSFILYAFGHEVIVDPGTYDYFTYPQWREYFRSTAAHNTIIVDGHDQAESRGPFMWGRRGVARCINWEPGGETQSVTGEWRCGEERSRRVVVHRRRLLLEPQMRRLTISDVLQAKGRHDCTVRLHFGPNCRVVNAKRQLVALDVAGGAGQLSVRFDAALQIGVCPGSAVPGPGWVSRRYHRREAAPTLLGRASFENELEMTTVVTFSAARSRPVCAPVAVVRDAELVRG